MSAIFHEHGASPPANSADDRAANPDKIPARVGIRSAAMRYWPAAAGGVAVLAALLGQMLVKRTPEMRPVQNGRQFSVAERRRAAESLRTAGIESSTSADGQLLVRPGDLTASNATLVRADTEAAAGSRSASASWLDTFASSRRQQAAAATEHAARLGRLLTELPGVEAAEVVWDEEPRVGRRQAPRVRATVFLRPEPGFVVGLDTVRSVRTAVAGSRAYLSAQDVTVMDLERRVTYGADSDPAAFAAEVRRAELIATCRLRIEAELADLAGVLVALDIEGPSGLVESPYYGSATPRAEPALPATRTRIAGLSGPNLRLEVPAESPLQAATDERAVPSVEATRDQLPQLVVSVVVPGQDTSGGDNTSGRAPLRRSGNASRDAEVRERIAGAVAGLPVALSRSRLNVTVRPAESEAMPSVRAGAETQGLAHASGFLGRIAAMRGVPQAVAGVLLVALLVVVRRRVGGRRRSPLPFAAARESRSAPGSSPPLIEFLPGTESTAWAPLLAAEPADVVAGLLRHLSADEVSQVMSELAPARQLEVLGLAPTAQLSAVEFEELRLRIRGALETVEPSVARRPAGPRVVQRRPSGSDTAAVFDDLVRLDEGSLGVLASRFHAETWSAALMGATPQLQRRLSKVRNATGVSAEVGQRRPMRLREIESAQRMILDEWQSLQLDG